MSYCTICSKDRKPLLVNNVLQEFVCPVCRYYIEVVQ